MRGALPGDFRRNLDILRELAPRLPQGFTTLFLPAYVARHGRGHVTLSLEALRYFTRFGSAQFAIREFLRDDLEGRLATLATWAGDANEHVRRVASEGTRLSAQLRPVPGTVSRTPKLSCSRPYQSCQHCAEQPGGRADPASEID